MRLNYKILDEIVPYIYKDQIESKYNPRYKKGRITIVKNKDGHVSYAGKAAPFICRLFRFPLGWEMYHSYGKKPSNVINECFKSWKFGYRKKYLSIMESRTMKFSIESYTRRYSESICPFTVMEVTFLPINTE